jgi:hypothetical protein
MITAPELPGATFLNVAALRTFVHQRLKYEGACQDFARTGDAHEFGETLASLGYDASEIAEHFGKPQFRIQEQYR